MSNLDNTQIENHKNNDSSFIVSAFTAVLLSFPLLLVVNCGILLLVRPGNIGFFLNQLFSGELLFYFLMGLISPLLGLFIKPEFFIFFVVFMIFIYIVCYQISNTKWRLVVMTVIQAIWIGVGFYSLSKVHF